MKSNNGGYHDFRHYSRFMIAVCGSGIALSAAYPPQTAIMDGMLGGRDVAGTSPPRQAHSIARTSSHRSDDGTNTA
jgi:hypothetical protein